MKIPNVSYNSLPEDGLIEYEEYILALDSWRRGHFGIDKKRKIQESRKKFRKKFLEEAKKQLRIIEDSVESYSFYPTKKRYFKFKNK